MRRIRCRGMLPAHGESALRGGRAIGRARRVRERDVLLGMLPFRRDSSEGKPSICTEGVEGRYAVRLLAIVAGDADATGEGERREVVAAGASGQKK